MTLSVILFPSAFLSDFVSVRAVIVISSIIVFIGCALKTISALPIGASRDLYPLLFTGQGPDNYHDVRTLVSADS